MSNIQINIKYRYALFFTAIVCIILRSHIELFPIILTNSPLENITYLLTPVSAILFFIHIVLYEKIRIVDVVLLLFAVINYLITKDSLIVLLIFGIVAAKSIPLKNIVTIYFYMSILTLFIVIILYQIAICDGVNEALFYTMRDGIKRYSLGFSHVNQLGYEIFLCYMAYVCLNDNIYAVVKYFIGIIAGLFVYLVPYSRTAVMGIVLFMIIHYIYRKKRYMANIMIKYSLLFAILLLVSSLMLFFYGYAELFELLNQILSGRLRYSLLGMSYYDVSWFGNDIHELGEHYVWMMGEQVKLIIDVAYIRMLAEHGIIGSLLIISLIQITLNKLIKKQNGILALVLACICIYALSEATTMNITRTYALFFLREALIFDTNDIEDACSKT